MQIKILTRGLLLMLLLTAASPLSAQQPAAGRYNGHGYAFYGLDRFAGGDLGSTATVGGGFEAFVWKGLTAGADGGYVSLRDNFRSGAGLVTVHGGYHFVNRDNPARLVPFVTMGYGRMFNFRGGVNLFEYGGGATWWFSRRVGARFEVRDYRWREGSMLTSVRFGVSFR